MADYGHKQGKKRDESNLGSLVDFLLANARLVLGVSGAAVLAIATLAVKRLIDRATSPPDDEDDIKAKQKSLEESWQELSLVKTVPKVRQEDLEEPLLSPVVGGTAQDPESGVLPSVAPLAEPRARLCLTLQEKLLSYYRDHVSVSEVEKALGKQLAGDICGELQKFLKNKYPELPFGHAFLSGYLCDDLISSDRLEVAFMLPLTLEPDLWLLIPGEQTVVNDPCFGMVRRTGVEYFPRGSSPWDRFVVGGYLSSSTINKTLHNVLVASINWPVIGSSLECVVRPVMDPKELKLEVRHAQIRLDINLCPMVEVGDKTLLPPSFVKPVENLWQRSFYAAEVSALKDLDARDDGVRQGCLNILKVVFENHPFWSKLGSSHLTHAILHLSETETTDWSEAALADRCQQVLEELVRYLEIGSLPCFFDSRINLLGHLASEEIEEIGYTLYEALAEPDLAAGLCL
ncbi:mitochondrial dynamics protein MID49 isoform X2 [Lacerta agilis]|uniref:mitochondrial dynamics protein MID49 isoform X2 n=1 Tax=Lacerta agilis TaxID=80427 RepID=UPI0014196BDA|nr:mitochondrial dynamics protein MID49 isoform X2 [Lacerta agilis]